MHDSRQDVRSRLMLWRRGLRDQEQELAAEAVSVLVAEELRSHRPGTVAAYLAHNGELDPARTLHHLHSVGWRVVLPVCGADASMVFCPWKPGERLVENRYGIGEPTSEPIDPQKIDVVLVPGVGFDERGARIGHGVGYYDRFFANVAKRGFNPLRLALAHDEQLVELPEPEEWDVPMQLIITPTRVISVDSAPTEYR